jgi:threonine aldolase
MVMPVDTNIVIFQLNDSHNAEHFVEKLGELGIKCNTFGKQMVRFVTHLDVSTTMIDHVIETLKKIY